jgi:hypothetical protein
MVGQRLTAWQKLAVRWCVEVSVRGWRRERVCLVSCVFANYLMVNYETFHAVPRAMLSALPPFAHTRLCLLRLLDLCTRERPDREDTTHQCRTAIPVSATKRYTILLPATTTQ